MKLNYFGYCIRDMQNDVNYAVDINGLLSAFCRGATPRVKRSIEYHGEKLFLFPRTERIYLLATTRDSEIIKKINTDNLTLTEINDILARNEKLGFAAYLYVGNGWLGVASTVYAPRIKTVSYFIDDLLRKIGLDNYICINQAFTHTATRDEMLAFPVISSATIRVGRDSTCFRSILGYFAATDDAALDVDQFEVRMIPKHGGEVTRAAKRMATVLPEDGLYKFKIRAKSALDEFLTDYYLDGKGSLSDFIHSKEDDAICLEMRNRITANTLLRGKTDEFRRQEAAITVNVQAIVDYSQHNNWTALTAPV